MKSTVQLTPVDRPRNRLGFWRFLLALLMGLGAWWSIGWLLEPKPLWRVRFLPGHTFMMPFGDDESGRWVVGYEMDQPNKLAASILVTSLNILNARNGEVLYRLPLQEEEWGISQYIEYRAAMPRFLGETLWRVIRAGSGSDLRYELRAWKFAQEQNEKVVHTWKVPPGSRFLIAFAPGNSPCFVTQTVFPSGQILADFSTDGWSRLLYSLATSSSDEQSQEEQLQRGIVESGRNPVDRGSVLSLMNTWRVSDSKENTIELLASWLVPDGSHAWPPMMNHDLTWIALGASEAGNPQTPSSPQPRGTLFYDGRTGKPLPTGLPTGVKLGYGSAGDMLLVHHVTPKSDSQSRLLHQLIDARTRKVLSWPTELPSSFAPTGIIQDQLNPNRFLVVKNMGFDPLNPQMMASDGAAELALLERNAAGIQLVERASLPDENQGMQIIIVTHLAGNELGVYGMIDAMPPALRKLAEKWDWCKPWLEKVWPGNQIGLSFYDVRTGQLIRRIVNGAPTQFGVSTSKYFYTATMQLDQATGAIYDSMSAWKLPMSIQTTSVWWGRASGLVVFMLAILVLRRRQLS